MVIIIQKNHKFYGNIEGMMIPFPILVKLMLPLIHLKQKK